MGNGVVQTKISAVTFDSSQFSKVASILAPILHFIELRDNGHVPTVYFEIFGSLKEELVNLSKVNLVSNDYSQSRLGKFARMVGPLSQQIKSFGLHHSFQQQSHGSNFISNNNDHIDYRSMGDFLATLSQLECCSIPVVSGLTEDAQSMAHLLSSLPPTLKHLYLTRVDSFSMIHLNNRWPVEPSYLQLTHLNIPAPVCLELAFTNFLNNFKKMKKLRLNLYDQTWCVAAAKGGQAGFKALKKKFHFLTQMDELEELDLDSCQYPATVIPSMPLDLLSGHKITKSLTRMQIYRVRLTGATEEIAAEFSVLKSLSMDFRFTENEDFVSFLMPQLQELFFFTPFMPRNVKLLEKGAKLEKLNLAIAGLISYYTTANDIRKVKYNIKAFQHTNQDLF